LADSIAIVDNTEEDVDDVEGAEVAEGTEGLDFLPKREKENILKGNVWIAL
jgi:hypothetical protein